MGIPRFYGHLQRANIRGLIAKQPPNIDILAFDLNGIFHPILSYMFKTNLTLSEQKKAFKNITYNDLLILSFQRITDYLTTVIKKINPNVCVILTVDGVSPLAKINQQRKRRYMTSRNSQDHYLGYDSNSIGPGTELMIKLDNFIRLWIEDKSEIFPQHLFYSGHGIVGEGEHKIFNFLREKRSIFSGLNIGIWGLDADFFMISLLNSDIKNIYLIRNNDVDDIFSNSQIYSETISINVLYDYFSKKMGNCSDFVFLMSLIGNDFLPSILESKGDIQVIVKIILDVYNECLEKNIITKLIDKNNNVIWQSVNLYLKQLFTYFKDKKYTEDIVSNIYKFPSWIFQKSITKFQTIGINKNNTQTIMFDSDKLRFYWYLNNFSYNRPVLKNINIIPFNDTDIELMAIDYLIGMNWVINYYKTGHYGIWYYPYLYAPLIEDLASVIIPEKIVNNILSKDDIKLDIVEQMLCILPPKNSNLAPQFVREMMTSEISPVHDLFPDSFEIDLLAINVDWLGTPVIPSINIYRIYSELKKILKNNTYDYKKINTTKLYILNKTEKKKYKK